MALFSAVCRQFGYWSIREPIMSHNHPSRRLLATNGFAWHIYMPYHDACLKGNCTVQNN